MNLDDVHTRPQSRNNRSYSKRYRTDNGPVAPLSVGAHGPKHARHSVLDRARGARDVSIQFTFYMLPSMANKVLFNCSILGPTVGRVFSVEALQSITVNQLKDAVKEKKKSRIGHMDGDELDIYMVSDLHVTHPLVYSSPRLNVWHDTFAALETPYKG